MAFRYNSLPDNSPTVYVRLLGYDTDPKTTCWNAPNGFYVIHYVLSGKGFLNGKPVRKGQGFYLPKDSERVYYSDPDDNWSYFWMAFDGSYIDNILSTIGIPNESSIFDMPSFPEFETFIRQLDNQYPIQESEVQKIYISQNLAKSYFYKVLSLHEQDYVPITNIVSSHALMAEKYILENYDKNIQISDIAHKLNINSKYLYELFSTYFNTSPKQYLNSVRITQAVELVTNSNLSIAQIAVKCGYSDYMQFSRFFKKNVGLSPTAFRKKNHN